IDIIVNSYIKKGLINYSDKDDFKQDINEQLINKIDSIQRNYNQQFLFTSYLSTIISNICLGIINKSNRVKKIEYQERHENKHASDLLINNIYLKQEIQKFDTIIKLFYYKKFKILLCLKLLYKIKVEFMDFKNYSVKINKVAYRKFMKQLGSITIGQKNDIYQQLASLFSRVESKKVNSESVRKWISSRIDEMIRLMNGAANESNYTKETFQYFVEYYFKHNEDGKNPDRLDYYHN
ncbi:MAG: hypothetical protein MI922_03030, partial [Bacteroidales bacterium]|nr:hypothetical protein [Bacteroidales bacterium]